MRSMKEENQSSNKKMADEVRTAGLMVAAEAMDIGCTTLNKVAFNEGINNFVFVVYTHALGALFLLPSSFLFHRKVPPPRLTSTIVFRLFLLGAVSYCCALFVFIGAGRSSPTLASAMNNLSPAFTFVMAIIFRMETLDFRVQSSLLKFIGTIVSIAGAFVVIFYKGPPVYSGSSSSSLLTATSPPALGLRSSGADWILGGFFLFFSSLFLSLIYIVKAWVLRDYPSELLVALISCSFETVVAILVAVVAAPDLDVWKLTHGAEMIAIFFTAVLTVGVMNSVQSWACRRKGPAYVAVFKPLQMIIAVFLGVFFLGDTLHLGSLLGGAVIALGFYTVLKGKAMEAEEKEKDKKVLGEDIFPCRPFEDEEAPLLQNKTTHG